MHTQADVNMQGHTMSSQNCIGAIARGVNCPKQSDPIDFAVFHIGAFKGFSLAVLSEHFINMLVLVCAALLFGLTFLSSRFSKIPQFAFYKSRLRDSRSPALSQRHLTRWLALHEKSPTFF